MILRVLAIVVVSFLNVSDCAESGDAASKGLILFELDGMDNTWAIGFASKGDTFVSSGDAKVNNRYVMLLWDLRERKLVKQIVTRFSKAVEFVDISPDESSVLAADRDGNVSVFEPTGRAITHFKMFDLGSNWTLDIKYVDRNNVLTIGYQSIASRRSIRDNTMSLYHLSQMRSYCAALSNNKSACAILERRLITVWSQMLDEKATKIEITAKDNEYWRMALSDDAARILCSTQDSRMGLFDVKTGRMLKAWNGHDGAGIGPVIALRGNKGFVSGDENGFIRVWDSDGELVGTLRSDPNAVMALAVNQDGTVLASGGWGRKLVFWDLNRVLKVRRNSK